MVSNPSTATTSLLPTVRGARFSYSPCPKPAWGLHHTAALHSSSSPARMLRLAVVGMTLSPVAGHASLIMPITRNAIDSTLEPWSHGKHPQTGWIEPYNCGCTNGTEAECQSGQSCCAPICGSNPDLQSLAPGMNHPHCLVRDSLVLTGVYRRLREVRRPGPAVPVVGPLPRHAQLC